MKSRFIQLKNRAVKMRQGGASIGEVEQRLGIPRSTLSGWFKNIRLSASKKKALERRWKLGLVKARKEAVKWHKAGKATRLAEARRCALDSLTRIGKSKEVAWELALAFLYLGEGAKKNEQTSLGSSDIQILKFFVASLHHLYNVPLHHMKCELHLRADQDPSAMRRYWSRQLGIPLKNFGAATLDPRTAGRKTYPEYKGVCIVRAPGVAIQRKLVYISREFCDQINAKQGG